MYFRFGVALLLVVAISIAGVAIEKMTLSYRRESTRQEFQLQELRDEHARMRLRTQELGAPARMVEAMGRENPQLQRPKRRTAASKTQKRPLLRWRGSAR